MSFATKIDLVGIAREGLTLRSNGQNASNSVLEIPGSDGSILGDEITGHIKAPTCEYAINGNVTLANLELGSVYSNSGAYALSRIAISTGAGQEPTVTADAVQIEEGATQTVCVYPVDSVTLTPARHALAFGAFTFDESKDLALQSSSFEASCQLTPTTVNNEPVASDATAGRQTVTATFWSSSEADTPNVSINSDWHITADWSCSGADASMFVWTVTLTKYLTADSSEV